jgi:ABC-type anion transport system duplicated permease subunit
MLDYLALAILLAVVVILAVAVVALFDLPYRIATRRNHPQRDAIHAACWLSLFTAGLLWPLAFIWALTVPARDSESPSS